MKYLVSLSIFLLLLLAMSSCEEEFTPPNVESEPQIVVEGYIEAAGDQSAPPYVLLTRTLPFFTTLDSSEFGDFFVHDAQITVDDGTNQVNLTELCLNDLTPEQIAIAENFLGTNVELVNSNFCVYLDLSFSMFGEEGKTYELNILAEGKELSATTSIPAHTPLDSVFFIEPPGTLDREDLKQMQAKMTDPEGPNYYRYFVQLNNNGFRRDDFSVIDDPFFDGREISFPLNNPRVDSVEFDLATAGLFTVGDTVNLKWVAFNKASFDFWNTIEFAAANQGPFSNYTIIDTNIEGGLGIWSGQSASYYERIVE